MCFYMGYTVIHLHSPFLLDKTVDHIAKLQCTTLTRVVQWCHLRDFTQFGRAVRYAFRTFRRSLHLCERNIKSVASSTPALAPSRIIACLLLQRDWILVDGRELTRIRF